MDDMSTENMAKGLNVYRSGPKGAATRSATGRLTVKASTSGSGSSTGKTMPPLRLSGVKQPA